MGKWLHRLSEINSLERTATCSNCGNVTLISMGRKPSGETHWRCGPAKHRQKRLKERPWILYKKSYCERCGFEPENPCQLDVDHIDGDNSNNDTSNLQTLCANCHRLKTFKNKDWEDKVLEVKEVELQ